MHSTIVLCCAVLDRVFSYFFDVLRQRCVTVDVGQLKGKFTPKTTLYYDTTFHHMFIGDFAAIDFIDSK